MKHTEQSGLLASREQWLQQLHGDYKKRSTAGAIR